MFVFLWLFPTHGGFTIGVEAALDIDWTPAGKLAWRRTNRMPGEPDLASLGPRNRCTSRKG